MLTQRRVELGYTVCCLPTLLKDSSRAMEGGYLDHRPGDTKVGNKNYIIQSVILHSNFINKKFSSVKLVFFLF